MKVFIYLFLFTLLSVYSHPEEPNGSGTVLYPDPEPFSVDAESAIYCISILKGSRYLEKDDTDQYRVVQVETVWSELTGYDETYPPGHRRRYDIIVNGSPLNWDNSYMEYGSDLINMHLLFLYRNQHPPSGLGPYSISEF